MSRTIERTLTMLLPTATNGIPRELIDTTASLIAQSRHKISNLNPTEEAGREMICAHLACINLRTKLDLPHVSDKPPAPVPPRLYKTLFRQFSETLVMSSKSASVANTPSKQRQRREVSATDTTAPTSSTKSKPSLRAKTSTSRLPSSSTFSATTGKEKVDEKLQPYISVVPDLCAASPEAIHHVTAGVKYIFSSVKYRNLTEDGYALLAAVYVVVVKELAEEGEFAGLNERGQMKWYEGRIKAVYQFLKGRGVALEGGLGEWRGKVDGVLEEVAGDDMRETKWFMDIPRSGNNVDMEEEEDEQGGDEEGDDEAETGKGKRNAGEAGMESGIGSMMQDRLDFLSDKRRKAFSEWKADALRRIAQLEA
ncbi:hypothetical protein TWF694_007338 [Orbilia ellipsospora]|uniref:ORC6 first cyclin-like domain-containing protein n=1 Tax=Orbilia ellipsospora TaxID=2528407 RepID=A0AAV9XHV6_9PEZI